MLLTKQQVFDTVATHLLTQRKRSTAGPGHTPRMSPSSCAYRGEKGLKCAVGCLIPDDLYFSDMEGNTVTDSRVAGVLSRIVEDDTSTLLARLQRIHDQKEPTYGWRTALQDLACELHLDSTCLQEKA